MSTIHFYIILKRDACTEWLLIRLSTIHFYIILKRNPGGLYDTNCLSTIHFYIILKRFFSHNQVHLWLEYHTFLHHSQTLMILIVVKFMLEYHTFLHHSQTSNSKIKCYHRHKNKVLKLNYSINFTSVSIYNITHSSFHATSFMIFNK